MKRINIYIRQDQIDTLEQFPGTFSEHLRRALDKYIKNLSKVSKSPSKGGDKHEK